MSAEWNADLFCHSGVDSRMAIRKKIPGGLKPKLFLTDPPYNLGFDYGSVDDSLDIDEYHGMLRDVFDAAYDAADDDAHLFIINYPEIIGRMWDDVIEPKKKNGMPRKRKYWKFKQWITWCYPNNWPPGRTKFTRASRAIIWMTKGKPSANIKQIVQPYRNPWDRRVREHMKNGMKGPALYDWWPQIDLCKNVSTDKVTDPRYSNQMPETLLRRIIHITTEPGDLVADPFAGTFSTVKAALHTSRLGWGCDLNHSTNVYHPSVEEYDNYYRIHHDRIKDHQFFDIDAKAEPFDFERAGISYENLRRALMAGYEKLPKKQQDYLALELERLETYSKFYNINDIPRGSTLDKEDVTTNMFMNLIELIPVDSIKEVLKLHKVEFDEDHSDSKLRTMLLDLIKEILPDRNQSNESQEESIPNEGIERNLN